jgi:RNA polymerase sigma factor (sigma-70 family)
METVTPSDESLVADMASGDMEAMEEFVERFQARAYGLARRLVDDPGLAEEVAQDALLRAWRYAATFDPRRGRVAPWLLTITRNLAVDAVRLRRDHPIDPDTLVDMVTELDEPRYDGANQLRGVLRTLPADQARPVVLAVYFGLTAQEIADQEGIPLGTAKTRIRRGLARLRQAWRDHDG